LDRTIRGSEVNDLDHDRALPFAEGEENERNRYVAVRRLLSRSRRINSVWRR